MKATIAVIYFHGTLFGLLALLGWQASILSSPAQLIVEDTFESYTVSPGSPVRLQTASGSTWTSQTTATVVDDSTLAFAGSQFVKITGNSSSAQAKRTFTSIPTSGTYYINFALYNNFSQSTLDNGTTTTSDDGNMQFRINDGTNNVLSLQCRGRSSNFELAAVSGGTTVFYDTGISYATSAWRDFVLAVDLATSTVDLYVTGVQVLTDISVSGYTTNLTTMDIRTAFLSGTDSLLVDNVAFYSSNPVPEPTTLALLTAGLISGCGMAVRRRLVDR